MSGTNAVTARMTVYTNASACSSTSVTGKGGRSRNFVGTSWSPYRDYLYRFFAFKTAQASMILAGLLFLSLLGYRPHRLRRFAGILLLAVVCFAVSCGGSGSPSSSSKSSTSNAATGTYTVTIVATDISSASVTASIKMTLTID